MRISLKNSVPRETDSNLLLTEDICYGLLMAKIIISLPDDLLKQLDEYCQEKIYTRSELIRRGLRQILFEKELDDVSGKENNPKK
jgi:Ribbon-helix-helix protein, copG family